MKAIYSSQKDTFKNGTGVGLGNFDGIHIGHTSLINILVNQCNFEGTKSVVYTFGNHPQNILKKNNVTSLITSLKKRQEIFECLNLYFLVVDKFDENLSKMSPESFVKNILVDGFNIKFAVVGSDYRFGYKGQGDTALLNKIGKLYGFRTIVVPVVRINGEKISSTMLRRIISSGNVAYAQKLLGRPFSILGSVKEGRKIGRTIGFPTANLTPEKNLVIPNNGVYISKTRIEGQYYNSMTNIGQNPTFGSLDAVSVETNILDFDKDIYNENIEVCFLKKIREEVRFNNKDDLITQLKLDLEDTKKFFTDY